MALYLEHFGLDEPPFRITPHTDFFFDGAERGATLEALIYAVVHDEGIVKVSGEVGSGKTMLCRMLMERLPPEVDTLYLATPSLASDEILHAIADELDLKLSERRTAALRELQEHLITRYGAGRRVVVLIDEAHVMPDDTLEQVRLLSNLESSRHKLLQIVLFGQPELDATLAKPSLRQLRDRITHAFRMRPLANGEVAKYLAFRMRAAGYRGPEVFSASAARLLARASGGLTRRINILADKALLACYSEATHSVGERHVRAAIADSEFAGPPRALTRGTRASFIGAAGVAAGLALGLALHWLRPPLNAPKPTPAGAMSAQPARTAAAEMEGKPHPLDQAAAYQPQAAEHSEPLLSQAQRRHLDAYSAVGYKLLSARIAATRELLERAAEEHYALELFVTNKADPARMERFLVRARDMVPLSELYLVPLTATRMRVLLGSFASEREAREAQQHLPPKYQQAFRVAPLSWRDIRREM
ncbi:MAG: ExeA family protein [Burkholderiales bacterium]